MEGETTIVYKKVRVKGDDYYPLFIDRNKPFQFGTWMRAEYHPTKGFAPRSLGIDTEGKEIGGWHCCYQPVAPHLADQLKSGERRVWLECEAKGKIEKYDRPESQGGAWLLAEYIKPLRVLREEK